MPAGKRQKPVGAGYSGEPHVFVSADTRQKTIILHHKRQVFKHFGVLMANKAPFCTFLWLTRTVFSRLLKKAVSMALWTKASLCVKSSLLEQSLPRTPSRLKIICVNPVILSNFSSCLRALRGERIRQICVNPWLIKDLRPWKELCICRDTFTDVISALQIRLFMQNEPNFGKAQMNVNKVLTRDYEDISNWTLGENKPNSKPIKANLQKDQMNVNKVFTKDYENKSNWALDENKPNTNPNKANFKRPTYSLIG